MEDKKSEDILRAGTGFMLSLSEAVCQLEILGYRENIVARGDHFCIKSGAIKFFPGDFHVDELLRFENSSDPFDQAAIYAISAPSKGIKGVYVESYGIYQDDLSSQMIDCLKNHLSAPWEAPQAA